LKEILIKCEKGDEITQFDVIFVHFECFLIVDMHISGNLKNSNDHLEGEVFDENRSYDVYTVSNGDVFGTGLNSKIIGNFTGVNGSHGKGHDSGNSSGDGNSYDSSHEDDLDEDNIDEDSHDTSEDNDDEANRAEEEKYNDSVINAVNANIRKVLELAMDVQNEYQKQLETSDSSPTDEDENKELRSPLGRKLLSLKESPDCSGESDICDDLNNEDSKDNKLVGKMFDERDNFLENNVDANVDVATVLGKFKDIKMPEKHLIKEDLPSADTARDLELAPEIFNNQESKTRKPSHEEENLEIQPVKSKMPFEELEEMPDFDSDVAEDDSIFEEDYDSDMDGPDEYTNTNYKDLSDLEEFLASSKPVSVKLARIGRLMTEPQFSMFFVEDSLAAADVLIISEDQKDYFDEFLFVCHGFIQGIQKKIMDTDTTHQTIFKAVAEKFSLIENSLFPRVHNLKEFASEALSCFHQIMSHSNNEPTRTDAFKVVNRFIFNYHYAQELAKIILDKEDSTELALAELSISEVETMKPVHASLLSQLNLTYAESVTNSELHDDDYDTVYLSTSNKDDDLANEDNSYDDCDDGGGFHLRKLLSVGDETCAKDDLECDKESKGIKSTPVIMQTTKKIDVSDDKGPLAKAENVDKKRTVSKTPKEKEASFLPITEGGIQPMF
jgi:hypothetical protein